MKKYLLCFTLFTLYIASAHAQNKDVLDSLTKIYKTTTRDTIQSVVLSEIAKQYRQSDPDTAQTLANKGLEFAKKINYPRGIATNLNILGIVQLNKGNYIQAVNYLFEGLDINKKINHQKDISFNLNNIGEVYRLQENYPEAIKYYNKALVINEKIGYKEGVAIVLNNLGEIYKEEGAYDKALEYFFKSLKICEEIKNESRAALRLNNIGEVYFLQGKDTEALKFFFDAIKLSIKFNNRLHLTREYNNLANTYLHTKDFPKALEYAGKSLEVAKEVNAKKEIAITLKTITNIYKTIQDYAKALIYYELFVLYQDSLGNEEVTKKVKEIQFNYEMNQKEKEILLLEAEKNIEKQNASTRLLYNVLFGLSALFLLILASALYQKNKFKFKANAILKEKNDMTESQNKELNKALATVEIQKQEMFTQNKELYQQQEELFMVNESLETTFKELKLTSERLNKSIEYAKQIQQLILPKKAKVDSFFAEHFSIYLPKDIVSGDFYWFSLLKDNKAVFVLADCTGHGVPGAFMSMIGNTLLHEIVKVKNIESPAEILLNLHFGIRNVLKQKESKNSDGMDTAVCLFEKDVTNATYKIMFSGAKSNLFYAKDNVINQLDGNKATIGGFAEKERIFTNQTFTLKNDNVIYFTSDGYIDQNNEKRERFSSNKFKQLLSAVSHLPIKEQEQAILFALKDHQKNELQRDDISVVGIRL